MRDKPVLYTVNQKQGTTHMLFHGTKDRVISLPQSESYTDKLAAD